MNFLFVLGCLLLNVSSFVRTSPCEITDRKYNCDYILQSGNRTVFFENEEQFNASSNSFLPAIQSLKYCDGSLLCRTDKQPAISPMNASSFLLCFSDVSCLLDEGFMNPCSCMHLGNLLEYNITNIAFNTGFYSCIKVGYKGLEAPYCLKAACKSFTAIEKFCTCPSQSWNCTCSSYCENLPVSPFQGTYILFLSFGDIYMVNGGKNVYVHWTVVTVLFIGLSFLLVTFCKLCERVVDTRRAPSVKSPCVEENQVNHIPPPPSYEQVMKDKCIEFKKSVTKPGYNITV